LEVHVNKTGAAVLPLSIRRKKLAAIAKESTLHEIIRDILLRIGYDWAEITHGPGEQGKDLVARGKSRTGGDENLAVVAKLGGISGSATEKRNLNALMDQVKTAFLVPYEGHRVRVPAHINKVLVVCTGAISDLAQGQIRSQAHDLRAVDFWPLDDLEVFVTEHLAGFYFDIQPHIHDYLIRLRERCVDTSADYRRLGSHISRALQDVFVEPAILPLDELRQPVAGRRGRRLGKTGIVYRDPTFSTFDTTYLEYPRQSVIVMGEPGSGKTFAVRRAAQRLIERRLAGDSDAPLPLLTPASVFAEDDAASPEADLARGAVTADALTEEQLRQELHDNRCVLFVDSLDGVATNHRRDVVLRKLNSLLSDFPNLRIVCTMRTMRFWRPEQVMVFQQAMILPMNNRSVAKLLENLLGRGKKFTGVLRAFSEAGLNRSLPKTPLVVTILAILHEQESMEEIPATVADLYDMFLQVYLGRWSLAEEASALSAYQLRLAVLREIACHLHENRRLKAPFAELQELADEYLSRRGHANQAREFLLDIARQTGLLVLLDSEGVPLPDLELADAGSVMFFHHSFQEYLMASRFALPGRVPDDLVQRFLDPWWSNVVTFYVGMSKDAPEVIQTLRQLVPKNPLACLTVGLQLGHVLQAAVQTPTVTRKEGCLHGSDLIQVFFSAYSELLSQDAAPVKVSLLHLLLALGILYSLAYGSVHLSAAQREAFDSLLERFRLADGDERLLLGLRVFSSAAALADRGDLSGMKDFVEAAKLQDFPVLQAAARVMEALEPVVAERVPSKVQSRQLAQRAEWQRLIRQLRRLIPKERRDSLISVGLSKPKALSRPVSLQDQPVHFGLPDAET
jgi:hypothetical protein